MLCNKTTTWHLFHSFFHGSMKNLNALQIEAITFLKAEAGAISATLNVFNKNMGHEEAFILNPNDGK